MKRIILLITILLIFLCSPVWATNYFVKDDGSDSNDGTTDAQAWITLDYAASRMAEKPAGDDLYLKCDDTWTEQYLHVTWSGVSNANRAIIGAYEGNGDIVLEGDETLPILDGNHIVPTTDYGLIHIDGSSTAVFVTIQNISVIDSGWHGIESNYVDDVNVDNCYVYQASVNGIMLARCLGGEVTNSIVDHAGYDTAKGTTSNAGIDITGVGSVMGQTDSIIVRGNIVKNCVREGIDILKGSTNCLIEDNEVYDNIGVGIYLSNSASATVRNNIIYESATGDLDRGIEVQNETATYVSGAGADYKIYGNFIANVSSGIKLVPISGGLTGARIYNNTIVDCGYNWHFANYSTPPGTTWSDNEIKNNLSYQTTLGTSGWHFNADDPTGITFSHNYFNYTDVAPYVLKDHAIGTNAIQAATADNPIAKTSGWDSITAGNLNFTAGATHYLTNHFELVSTSVCIDAATNLTDVNDQTVGSGQTDVDLTTGGGKWFYGGNDDPLDNYTIGSATVTLTGVTDDNIEWSGGETIADNDLVYYRHFTGALPDIGADEYIGTPQNTAPVISSVSPGSTTLYADGGANWNDISCSSTITDAESDAIQNIVWDFGIEYLTDGTMESDPTANWTAENSTLALETTTKHAGSNSLKVSDDAGVGSSAYQAITTEIGAVYRLTAYGYNPSAAAVTGITVMAGNSAGSWALGYTSDNTTQDSWVALTVDITASATTTYFAVEVWGAADDGSDYAFFDDATVRMISEVEDPGTVTIPDPGSYPTTYSVTIDCEDEHGLAATQYTFDITINQTGDTLTNTLTGDSDCINHWAMADATDEMGNDNLTSSGDPTFTGGAAVLDGNDYLYATLSNDVDGDFTIFAKFHFDAEIANSTHARIAGEWDEAGDKRCWSISVYGNANGKDEIWFGMGHTAGAANYSLTDDSYDLVHDTDYNVIATYDNVNDDVHVYLYNADGTTLHNTDPNATWANDINSEAVNFRIGEVVDPTGLLTGSIFEMAILKREVSEDEAEALASGQFPLAIVGEIIGVSADGTYGKDDSLTVAIQFTRNGDPIEVTWTDAALPYAYITFLTDVVDLQLYHSFPATTVAATTHEFSTHATDANYVNSMIATGMNSADLSATSITLEGGTFTYDSPAINCDMAIVAGHNLDDNAAIVIDAIAPIVGGTNGFYHCDSSKSIVAAETTYNEGDTCYLCVESDGDAIFFVEGPLGNLQIGTDMSYPDKEEFEYYAGIRTSILQFYRVIHVGDRDTDLQAEGVAEGTGLIHGATILQDSGGNEMTYTLDVADPAGGNIIISAPKTDWYLSATGDYATFTAFDTATYSVPDDKFICDYTGNLNTDASGTSGHEIIFTGTITGTVVIDEDYIKLDRLIVN